MSAAVDRAVGTDVAGDEGPGRHRQVVRFDAIGLGLVTEIEVGTAPNAVSATDDVIWVTNGGDNTVTRIDPDTNEVTRHRRYRRPRPRWPRSGRRLGREQGGQDGHPHRPDTNEVVATVEARRRRLPGAIAATASGGWVTDGGTGGSCASPPPTRSPTRSPSATSRSPPRLTG